ncbi:hypothetical protein A9972_08040 [Pseudomonas sp. UME83]|nr:hypothetical protein [Pseudomonas sp. UMC76]MBB1637989.1 hypothetical protein [Pseudomonas sp. UME83]
MALGEAARHFGENLALLEVAARIVLSEGEPEAGTWAGLASVNRWHGQGAESFFEGYGFTGYTFDQGPEGWLLGGTLKTARAQTDPGFRSIAWIGSEVLGGDQELCA